MVYILLIFMILSNAGETISYKNTKVSDSSTVLFGVTFWSLILSLPILFVAGLCGDNLNFDAISMSDVGYLLLVTVMSLFSIVFWAKASQHLPMSIAEGVSEIYIAFLTFFYWLIFGGRLSVWHIILLCLVIFACLLLAYFQNGKKVAKYNYKIGFFFLSLWVILYIIKGLIPGALAKSGMSGVVYNFVLNLLMFLITFVYMVIKKKNVFKLTKVILKDKWLMIVGICRIANHISLINLALKMNLGIVDAVSVFGLVIITLYERLIMKEKINWKCYILLAIIAVCTALLGIL